MDASFRREIQDMAEQLQWFLDRRFPLHPNTRAEALDLLHRAGLDARPRARTEDLLESFVALLEQRNHG